MRSCSRVSTSLSSWISLVSHLSHPLPFFVTVAVDQQDPHHLSFSSLCCIPPFSRSNSCSETTHALSIFSLASQYVLIPPPFSSSRLCHQQVAARVQIWSWLLGWTGQSTSVTFASRPPRRTCAIPSGVSCRSLDPCRILRHSSSPLIFDWSAPF